MALPLRSSGPSRLLRLHLRDLHDTPRPVVRRPLANLDPILEGAGAHQRTILAIPFPVSGHLRSEQVTLPVDRAVFVVVGVRLRFELAGRHVDSARDWGDEASKDGGPE